MVIHKSRIAVAAAVILATTAVPSLLAHNLAQASTSDSPSILDLSMFASQIETLGTDQYPDSFTGAELTSSGVTDVYLVSPSNIDLVSAINSLNTHGYPVQFINVSHSYNQLDAISQSLSADSTQLRNEGVILAESWPDPASGTVVAEVANPTSSDISALASAKNLSVTPTTYTGTVSAILQQLFGSAVTLDQDVATAPMQAADRYDDSPPYLDGDWMYNETTDVNCTGGWNILNSSGKPFMITAGHCGTGTFINNYGTIGTTSTNWHNSSSGKDFQAVTESGGLGYVWTDYGNNAPVTGWLTPAVGANLTFNGQVTGESHGSVTSVNATVYNIYDSVGKYYYDAVHQIIASTGAAANICVGGDSGGPVYQQYSNSTDVSAVGTITAYFIGSNGYATQCAATMMSSILTTTGGTLVTY